MPVGVSRDPADAALLGELFDGAVDHAAFEGVEDLRDGVRNHTSRPFLLRNVKQPICFIHIVNQGCSVRFIQYAGSCCFVSGLFL